ncbi:MAG TPA: tRNA lysidine(34) synthetase TilS [Gemmatimonadaceae bacterium]|nr:tRNA lysidine(34) synthetase TilS [Gemmatimonadaceae bacterium]
MRSRPDGNVHYLPRMRASIVSRLQQTVADSLGGGSPIVLAISGGVDSMVLLDAAAATVPAKRLCVATYDHGTGPAATNAAALVRARAALLGLECESERSRTRLRGRTEAELRNARWRFLRSVAARRGAIVATAHTQDDQVETVLMRVLRGAGARGLAGMFAPTDVVRPLLSLTRHDVMRYARARNLDWIEDPSNQSLGYLRNRVRHELLPTLRTVRPAIDRELLDAAQAGAAWRRDVTACVDRVVAPRIVSGGAGVDADATALLDFEPDELKVLWPEIAARAGIALDRRGMERLASFTSHARVGARIQLSGRWDVVRSRDAFQLRASGHSLPADTALELSTGTTWDGWAFRAIDDAPRETPWSAWLPSEMPLLVRRWKPGDVMCVGAAGRLRKVKYLLSDAGITGHERARWPVVLAGDQIVWIPGVRRSAVAAARSGRPGLAFACEYVNR